MKYEYKPSFDRTFKKLSSDKKIKITKAIFSLIDFFETGERAKGLGLKQLRADFWEIRVGINNRVIFLFTQDTVSFLIVGTHDEIRKYLKKM